MTILFASGLEMYSGEPNAPRRWNAAGDDRAVFSGDDYEMVMQRGDRGGWEVLYTPTGGKTLRLRFDHPPAFFMDVL